MISAQPECKFDKKWLEKDRDSWHDSCSEYELVYYRPVLFKSCASIVAREGLVGNRKHREFSIQNQKHHRQSRACTPTQASSTPLSGYRSSQAQVHDCAYEGEATFCSTGTELRMHKHSVPTQEQLIQKHQTAMNWNEPSPHDQDPCIQDQPHRKLRSDQSRVPVPPKTGWSYCNSGYGYRVSSRVQLRDQDTKLPHKPQRAPATGSTTHHQATAQQPAGQSANMMTEWQRKLTPMYAYPAPDTDPQRMKYYNKLRVLPPTSQYRKSTPIKATARPLTNKQHTPKLQGFNFTPDDHEICL